MKVIHVAAPNRGKTFVDDVDVVYLFLTIILCVNLIAG